MAENFGTHVTPMQQTAGYDATFLLDLPDEQRLAAMKKMGVANTEPRLPHSPALKVKKTGIVFPWLEILADQTDKFVCCDLDGNEDEAVWGPKVVTQSISNRELTIMAQAQALQKKVVQDVQAQYKDSERYMPSSKLDSGQPEYEKHGVISLKDVQNLREQLHGTDTDNQGSVERPE